MEESQPLRNLEPDILIQIFHKLPIKSVSHCKLVCKEWHSLISDPFFITDYTPQSRLSNHPLNLMMIPHHYNPPRKNQVSPLTYEIKTSYDPLMDRGPQPLPSTFTSHDRVLILGSCNGLAALYREGGDLCLFNPYVAGKEIMVHVSIYDRSHSSNWSYRMLYGLCHDPANDEYKAVLTNSEFYPSHRFYVVSFKDGSCKVKSFRYRAINPGEYNNTATIIKGVPYWICGFDPKHPILYFDLKTDEFQVVPKIPDGKRFLELGSLDGQLTATTLQSDGGLGIWAMKENENGDCSWSMLFVVVNKWPSLSTIVWMIKDVEILIDVKKEVLMIYNVKNGTWRQLQRKMRRSLYGILAYVPTFISPIQ